MAKSATGLRLQLGDRLDVLSRGHRLDLTGQRGASEAAGSALNIMVCRYDQSTIGSSPAGASSAVSIDLSALRALQRWENGETTAELYDRRERLLFRKPNAGPHDPLHVCDAASRAKPQPKPDTQTRSRKEVECEA